MAEITKRQGAGDMLGAASLYPPLLKKLGEAWGEASADIAPYCYNLALALRLAGRQRDAIAVASKGLEKWPDCLQLRVLAATARADQAISRGAFDGEAESMLRSVLEPSLLPRLRGLRLDPAVLQTQHADLLFRGRRFKDAIEASRAALALSPGDRRATELAARSHIALQQFGEALPLLQQLARERTEPHIELWLGMTLLDSGKPAEAWDCFSKLLGDRAALDSLARAGQTSIGTLKTHAARALNQLDRHREAVELLLGPPAADPDEVGVLQQLAAAARRLGAAEGASAIDRRVRRLQTREKLRESAAQARAAAAQPSIAYYEALAAIDVDDTGEALRLLGDAIRLGTRVPQVHLERARVRALLGRMDVAEAELRGALAGPPSPLLKAGLAWVLAARGRADEARAMLAQAAAAPGGATEEASALEALRTRVSLELGDAVEARPPAEVNQGTSESALTLTLGMAESLVRSGRDGEAAAVLQGGFQALPGGASWARALRTVIEAPPEADPSDLLDHPRLLLRAPHAALGAPWLESVRALHARRVELITSMAGKADPEVLAVWHRLLEAYREAKAERKAREVAYYLVHLRPEGLEEHRAFARALAAPEEILPRLRSVDVALRLVPEDLESRQLRAAARSFLGLK